MDKKIKVMIADDQVILAEGIKSVLETDPELEVIGLAFDGFDALEKMEKNPPECSSSAKPHRISCSQTFVCPT